MNKAQVARQAKIEVLALQVKEYANKNRGGSCCSVPSASKSGVIYRVDVDENYNPVACTCQGGRGACQHKEAVVLYYSGKLASLLNNDLNPRYELKRNGALIIARLNQFSQVEKEALQREAAWLTEEAAKREAYNSLFDPNGIDARMYA